MLNDTVASGIRARISDFHTQNVSAYNPDGLESLDTYVPSIHNRYLQG